MRRDATEPSQNGAVSGASAPIMRAWVLPRWASGNRNKFQVLRPALGGPPFRCGNHAGRLVGDDGEKMRQRGADLLVPQVEEWLVLEFAPEQRAHARSRETERMAAVAVEFQNEHVTERAADRARLDLAAFGRGPFAAPRSPVAEQFAA